MFPSVHYRCNVLLATADATLIVSITTMRATTVNNNTMRFIRYLLTGGAHHPNELSLPLQGACEMLRIIENALPGTSVDKGKKKEPNSFDQRLRAQGRRGAVDL